jgi:hypothetical protein
MQFENALGNNIYNALSNEVDTLEQLRYKAITARQRCQVKIFARGIKEII